MKKITFIVSAMLISVASFAIVPATSGSSTVVVTNNGSSVFKLYYKAIASGKVKVSILDQDRNPVFSETISKSNGFARPYNFSGLSEGDYTIEVEDTSGKMVEKVSYGSDKAEKLVKVTKVAGNEGKYLLTASSRKADFIGVKIFDSQGGLLLQQSYPINGEFAQLFNLKKIGTFTIQVEDSSGVLKTISY